MADEGPPQGSPQEDPPFADRPDADFEGLLEFLKEERGFDFTGYKRASLMRRVQRRMAEVGVTSFEGFHDHLMVHPEEFTPLFNTILINVTSFFRDREAWLHLLDEVLPAILARRAGQPIRVWSAGCASGEEAYTLAIVLSEALGAEDFKARVKIYATDVDEEALAVARLAAYSERDLQAVPEEWREKYFRRQGDRYVFDKELRRSVIFGRNDLVQDAPISHVDVLACRNTLMYFNAETQARILQRMHFALRPDGVIFLGKAEMLLSHNTLFRALDLKRRFFTRVPAQPRLPPNGRLGASETDAAPASPDRLQHAALLASPVAQLVIDPEGLLSFVTSRAAYLFGLSTRDVGRPFQDLEVSYRPVELRSRIQHAAEDRHQVWVRDVTWTRGAGEPMFFEVQVMPLSDESGTLVGTAVVFNEVTRYRQLQQELEYANGQLETAYEELQSTNEELETTNEELQSTVEELETTNEELQSTNEELETMNEELQAMNDELQASSETQHTQQDHFFRLNRYISAVLSSMNSGVVVVDEELRVLTWNARAEDLWGVRADEAEGRHLFNLDIGLPMEALRPLLKLQLDEDHVGPHEVARIDAVNRRGRAIDVRVTVTRLSQDGEQPNAAVLVMEVVEPPQP